MNYIKHYNLLCERARYRTLDSYTEKHHIIPRCMGGTDDIGNLVDLTPEEHYVAHQLLVKMYPKEKGLIWAALQMTGHGNGSRVNNKLYGWLKRKYQHVAKQRKGTKNGSYGRRWYYHPDTLDNIKCLPEEVPEGYIKGRKLTPHKCCIICDKRIDSKYAKYCKTHRREIQAEQAIKRGLGVELFLERDIIEAIKNNKNMRAVCLSLNFKVGGTAYKKIKDIMEKHNLSFDK